MKIVIKVVEIDQSSGVLSSGDCGDQSQNQYKVVVLSGKIVEIDQNSGDCGDQSQIQYKVVEN